MISLVSYSLAARIACFTLSWAHQLLDALITYDELVWPRHYVRHHHMWRTSLWRSQIDQVLAHQILAGDRRCLTQRLQTFAAVPQGLASLLQQLQHAVTDAEGAIELHAVWPLILDALLPNVRTRDDDAYHGDIEELNQALLPLPEPDVDYWPWQQTISLAIRWRDAYRKHAELADRAILFALRLFGATENAAQFVLPLFAGADSHWVRSSSRDAVSFLKLMLESDISQSVAGQLRTSRYATC
jgi:hypothetical protein